MEKSLSVIIPAYNEAKLIRATLEETAVYLRTQHYRFEILVIDDGSSDGTAARAAEAAKAFPEIHVHRLEPNRGKGEAVRYGIGFAQYPYCLFMDADNSTSIREWDAFERSFAEGVDAVFASRHLPGARLDRPQPWIRRVLGGGYRVLSRALFGLRASDFNCGFKAYRTVIAKQIYSEVEAKDWVFDVEVFCLMKKYRARWQEVPVRWRHEEKNRSPFWSTLRQVPPTLKSLARLKRKC